MSERPSIWEEEVHVNTFECDFNRRWKPAAFFQHLTETASIHAERLGFGFEELLSHDQFWVLSRLKIQFHAYPTAGETVYIRTWPKDIQQKLFYVRDFQVRRSNGEPLASASSAWLVISAKTRRMLLPQTLNLDLPNLPGMSALDEPLEKIALSEDGQERMHTTAGYSSVDMVGHVNNARYVEWISDCFSMDDYRQCQMDWLQINYNNEIRPGDKVAVLASQVQENGTNWVLEGVNRSNGTRSFEAALGWKTS